MLNRFLNQTDMKSITIHGMEPELAARLERKARESGLSLNRTIKKLLAAALGVEPGNLLERKKDLEAFSGVWSKQEARAFAKAIEDFERIDDEDWE